MCSATSRLERSSEALDELEVELSLLSLVCRELNNRRLRENLPQISADLLAGNRDQILQRYYERSIADQPRGVRAFIEDELLTESGFRIDLPLERAEASLRQRGASPTAIAKLVDRRLLHLDHRLNVVRVELTHDVLAKPIQRCRDRRHGEERLRRRIYRVIAGALGVLVLGAIGFWIWSNGQLVAFQNKANEDLKSALARETDAKKAAETAQKQEQQTREEAKSYAERLAESNAARCLAENDVTGAGLWFADALAREDDPAHKETLRRRIEIGLAVQPGLAQIWMPKSKLTHALFVPDGTSVLIATEDGGLELRRLGPHADPLQMKGDGRFTHVEINAEGSRMLLLRESGVVELRDAKTLELTSSSAGSHSVKNVRPAEFRPLGEQFATLDGEGRVQLWSESLGFDDSPVPLSVPKLPNRSQVRSSAFAPDGSRIALGCDLDPAVYSAGEMAKSFVRSVDDDEVMVELRHPDNSVRQIQFNPDGSSVAAVIDRYGRRAFVTWDSKDGASTSYDDQDRRTAKFWFHPSGDWLLRVADDAAASLLRLTGEAAIRTLGRDPLDRRLDPSLPPFDRRPGTYRQDWRTVPQPSILWKTGILNCAFSPDGRYVAVATTDRGVRVGYIDSNAVAFAPLIHGATVRRTAFSPNGRWLLTATDDAVRIWDLMPQAQVQPPLKWVRDARGSRDGGLQRQVVVGPTGDRVVLAQGDGTVLVVDPMKGRSSARLYLGDVVEAFDGDRLVTRQEQQWAVWDVAGGTMVGSLPREKSSTATVWFSSDGTHALRTFSNQQGYSTSELWNVVPKAVRVGAQDTDRISDAVFSPDGRWLATRSANGQMGLRSTEKPEADEGDLGSKTRNRSLDRDQPESRDILRFSPDGAWFLYVVDGTRGEVRSLRDGVWTAEFALDPPAADVQLLGDGSRVAIVAEDKSVQVRPLSAIGASVPSIALGAGRAAKVVFSPDGRLAAAVTNSSDSEEGGGFVQVWSLETGAAQTPFLHHPRPIDQVAFFRDGRRLLTATEGAFRVWDLEPGASAGLEPVAALHLRCGQEVVSLDKERSVRVSPLRTGDLLAARKKVSDDARPIRRGAARLALASGDRGGRSAAVSARA